MFFIKLFLQFKKSAISVHYLLLHVCLKPLHKVIPPIIAKIFAFVTYLYTKIALSLKIKVRYVFLVPRPPTNMSIEKTTTNSVIVQWTAPVDSLISEYAIRYRTDTINQWIKLPPVQNTDAEVADMTPGERYTIQVNTVSYGLESNDPQQLNHTVRK